MCSGGMCIKGPTVNDETISSFKVKRYGGEPSLELAEEARPWSRLGEVSGLC